MHSDNQSRFHKRKKELFRRLKTGENCFDCGISYPYYVLHFDHVGTKNHEVANLRHASLDKLLAELSLCDLICANCHAVRTHNRKQDNWLPPSPAAREAAVALRNAKAKSLWLEIPSSDTGYAIRQHQRPVEVMTIIRDLIGTDKERR